MRDVRSWKRRSSKPVFEHALFSLEVQTVEAEGGDTRPALVLHPTDWVNIIALSEDDRALMVRQWRFGRSMETLEIPGGMVDPGEDMLAAARRELLEETGFEASDWLQIGEVDPNPAFQSNSCGTFLARSLHRVGEPEGDGQEEITVEWRDLTEITRLIDSGVIRHSLVIAAFYYYEHWNK